MRYTFILCLMAFWTSTSNAVDVTTVPEAQYALSIKTTYKDSKVIVVSVEPGSPALRMRSTYDSRIESLKPGDELIEMDGMYLNKLRDIRIGLNRTANKRDGTVRLRVKNARTKATNDWWVQPKRITQPTPPRPPVPELPEEPEEPEIPYEPEPRYMNVKVILVALTDDERIGFSVNQDLRTMRGILGTVADERNIFELKGDDIETDVIVAKLERMKIDPDDTLLVYISGHGGYHPALAVAGDPSEGHAFQSATGKLILRSTIWQAIKKKGARLNIVLSDACNSILPPDAVPAEYGGGYGGLNKLLRSLLLDYKGNLDINGASRDQLGWCNNLGGIFTFTFQRIISNLEEDKLDWRALMTKVSSTTNETYHNMRNSAIKDNKAGRDMRQQEHQVPQIFVYDVTPK